MNSVWDEENIFLLKKRLLFNSTHRGCKEMDIILGNFAIKFLSILSDSDLYAFLQILELDDSFLYKCFTGNVCLVHENKDVLSLMKRITLYCNENLFDSLVY